MAARPAFEHGQIVIVEQLLDPRGQNPKDRACVVMTHSDRIVPGALLDVVAITTKVPEPLPPDHVLLPWHRAGHPRTGLNRRNAAVCSWLDAVEQGRVMRRIGVVPGDRLALIAAALADFDRGCDDDDAEDKG